MSQAEILDRIVKEALKWDSIQEIPGNQGWENQEFEKIMKEVGWEEGQAWCAFFVKMVYYKIYIGTSYGPQILSDFTGSATQTFRNCQNDPRWDTATKNPVPGSVVIWRKWHNGRPDWRGHAGIIIEAGAGQIGSHFKSLEGNTNEEGGRIGKEVAIKTRMNNHGQTDGLVVEGFILPPIPLDKIEPKNIEL